MNSLRGTSNRAARSTNSRATRRRGCRIQGIRSTSDCTVSREVFFWSSATSSRCQLSQLGLQKFAVNAAEPLEQRALFVRDFVQVANQDFVIEQYGFALCSTFFSFFFCFLIAKSSVQDEPKSGKKRPALLQRLGGIDRKFLQAELAELDIQQGWDDQKKTCLETVQSLVELIP